MANCNSCSGSCEKCASCGGCRGNELVLTIAEVKMLEKLGQIPFLPVARHMGAEEPAFPEEDTPEMTLLLQCMEKKGLISLDYDKPLRGCDYGPYRIRGSLALTERGQKVLELLQIQGIGEG